jgi:hypothetical protein
LCESIGMEETAPVKIRHQKANMDRDGGHGKETDSYSDDAEEEATDAELRNGK